LLYHYTSFEKLKNIIETQQLWLTKISDFIDISEFNHTIDMISKELSVSFDELLHEVIKVNNNIFVGCFCSDYDKPYLWENYGGFNIGFSKDVLMSMVYYQQRAYGYITANSNFLRCEYCSERQKNFIKKAFNKCAQKNQFTIPVEPLAHLATGYKKSKFCLEKETRIVLYLKDGSPVKTLGQGNNKVNYFILPFQNDHKSQPIKSITIGPTSYPDKKEDDLRNCLEKQKLEDIDIKHSKISYKEFSKFQAVSQMNQCENCESNPIIIAKKLEKLI